MGSVLVSGWISLRAVPADLPSRDRLAVALLDFARTQRWYAGHSRIAVRSSLLSLLPLNSGTDDVRIAVLEVAYDRGSPVSYVIPVASVDGTSEHDAIATVGDPEAPGKRERALVDATDRPALVRALQAMILQAPDACGAFDDRAALADCETPVHRISGEQSNTCWKLGDRIVIKLLRRLEEGISPEIETLAHLGRTDFSANIPRLLGSLEISWSEGSVSTLAFAETWVCNQDVAWSAFLAAARAFLLDTSPRDPELAMAARAGTRTAEMHFALQAGSPGSAFCSVPWSPEGTRNLHAVLLQTAADSAASLRSIGPTLPDPTRALVDAVLAVLPSILSTFDTVLAMSAPGMLIRCHGDYHLGQLLVAGEDLVVIDFDGEPDRPIADRRTRRSPLVDVAAMLRSFDYAAEKTVEQLGFVAASEPQRETWNDRASVWRDAVSGAFLDTYYARLHDAGLLPQDASTLESLLRIFVIEKALREVSYEANHRPAWLGIPLRGLLRAAGAGDSARSPRGSMAFRPTLGAIAQPAGRCCFRVWAPKACSVQLRLLEPVERSVPLRGVAGGYFEASVDGVEPGTTYMYRLDGDRDRPDPASRWQPHGVHRPSAVVREDFPWNDQDWKALPLRDWVLYEVHVGTFTPEGTFDAIVARLDELRDLGITTLSLMPVAQFPGERNWGYDGVHPFAVQNSYGGPDGLRHLVRACHERGMAVVLDIVDNHLGPEGNYLADFGPYFTDQHRTPWGAAVNFDGPDSDPVRRFFLERALHFQLSYHVDGFRLDAIHAVHDSSPWPYLRELQEAVQEVSRQTGRPCVLIAETNRNDPRVLQGTSQGGLGLAALWSDDFHHALHALLTGERGGYYADFGAIASLAKVFREGWALTGQYSVHRRRRHGAPWPECDPGRLVVFAQNHDQVGNRLHGERLSTLLSFGALKLALGCVLLSPFVPMLFMGEEYGEVAPFLYFVSHGDDELVASVRSGRRNKLQSFSLAEDMPDPQAEPSFQRSKLDWTLRSQGKHRVLLSYVQQVLRLRKEHQTLPSNDGAIQSGTIVSECQSLLAVTRSRGSCNSLVVMNFGGERVDRVLSVAFGRWRKVLDSADSQWAPAQQETSQQLQQELVALDARDDGLSVTIESRSIQAWMCG